MGKEVSKIIIIDALSGWAKSFMSFVTEETITTSALRYSLPTLNFNASVWLSTDVETGHLFWTGKHVIRWPSYKSNACSKFSISFISCTVITCKQKLDLRPSHGIGLAGRKQYKKGLITLLIVDLSRADPGNRRWAYCSIDYILLSVHKIWRLVCGLSTQNPIQLNWATG